jgi:ABC-2 type transport system permease protein
MITHRHLFQKFALFVKKPWFPSHRRLVMKRNIITRATSLAFLLMKEQLKEPIALFWIIVSPCMLFYFMALSRGGETYFNQEYIDATSWFYSYIASSVAFFGFSFYIIGRRESGFTRSFIYNKSSKAVFLLAQFLAYSLIAIIYCSVFYLSTHPPFGAPNWLDFFNILIRFYLCYILFCTPGLLLTLAPLNFQNANTLISIVSFTLLATGVAATAFSNTIINAFNTINPLALANQLMLGTSCQKTFFMASVIGAFIITFFITLKFLRITPVWSRY